MNKALIETSTNNFVNQIELPSGWSGADGEWELPSGHSLVDGNGRSGCVWNGSIFTDPNALSADEVTAINLATFRATRNSLLADCDWTQASDSPLTDEVKATWATYREALRDLPATDDFDPLDVTWPDVP
jgi:hypothetical protein